MKNDLILDYLIQEYLILDYLIPNAELIHFSSDTKTNI